MERHHEKRRDMARSILPSKHRKGARDDLARAKRANRRTIRQDLSMLQARRHAATPIEAEGSTGDRWDEHRDLRHYPSAEILSVVRQRRQGDKLNHFIRWAIATTADLPVEDRLPHLRSIVGVGLVGDHAISHLAREADLRPRWDHDRLPSRYRWLTTAQREVTWIAELDVLRALLHEIVNAPGGLARLNRCMKTCGEHRARDACVEAGCVTRCLAGAHDVDRFLLDVAGPFCEWRWVRRDLPPPAGRLRTYLHELRDAAALGTAHAEDAD